MTRRNIIRREDLLFAFAVLSLLIFRIFNLSYPAYAIKFGGFLINHFWIGVVLLLVGLLISRRAELTKIVIIGLGLGLIADELVFLLVGTGLGSAYWKPISSIGAFICLFLIYIFREKITDVLIGHRRAN